MKFHWLFGLSFLTSSLWAAEPPPKISASALQDEAIQRPGDYSQVCDAGEALPFDAPPIPAYGLAIPQSIFPSKIMMQQLAARRNEVVKEIGVRLEKLDLLKPPPAPRLAKKQLFPTDTKDLAAGEMNPNEPSRVNPRTLSPLMLTIIIDLQASEVLPQLLRLEDSLFRMTKTAAKNPEKAPLPTIDMGGTPQWIGMMEDFKNVEDWEKAPRSLKRKRLLFDDKVFDREILGAMLELLHQKNYVPLKESTFGKERAEKLRTAAKEDGVLKEIKSAEDVAKSKDNQDGYIRFDGDVGVPYWRWEHQKVKYTDALRDEVRKLVQSYLDEAKAKT